MLQRCLLKLLQSISKDSVLRQKLIMKSVDSPTMTLSTQWLVRLTTFLIVKLQIQWLLPQAVWARLRKSVSHLRLSSLHLFCRVFVIALQRLRLSLRVKILHLRKLMIRRKLLQKRLKILHLRRLMIRRKLLQKSLYMIFLFSIRLSTMKLS